MPIDYRVDQSYEYYLNNWYAQMNLVCTSMVPMNFMMSARYIAYGISGFILFSIPDNYGRKWTTAITGAVMIFAQLLMIFVPTYEARLIGFILFGVAMLKMTVPFVYMYELVPSQNVVAISATMCSFDLSTLMIFNLYLLYISRDWFPLIFAMTILATLALIFAVICIPESP